MKRFRDMPTEELWEEKAHAADPVCQPSLQLYIDSSMRIGGTVNNASFNLQQQAPMIRDIYSISLKSFTFLNTIYSIGSAFTVSFSYESNPSGFITSAVFSPGNYAFSMNTALWSNVSALPTLLGTQYENDLRYQLIYTFGGAIQSIAVSSLTGIWQWVWDASVGTVGWGATTSSSVYTLLQMPANTLGTIWTSTGQVTLGAPTLIAVASRLLDNEQLTSMDSSNQWVSLVPVTAGYGDLNYYEPEREERDIHSQAMQLRNVDIQIVDPITGAPIVGLLSWSMVLRLYVQVKP